MVAWSWRTDGRRAVSVSEWTGIAQAAISLLMVGVVWIGIVLMRRSGDQRSERERAAHEEFMVSHRAAHEEFMASHRAAHEEVTASHRAAHEEVMASHGAAHEEVMAGQRAAHEEFMVRHEEFMAAHREAMTAHKETMVAHRASHAQAMRALEALIERTGGAHRAQR